MPDFVGPVLAKHTADFGRYPMNQGTEPFRKAASAWLSSRFKLPRPLDPASELLVLNGSREGLFLAAITAARYVSPRPGKPAILMPNPFYPVYGAGRPRSGLRAGLSADHRRERLPARSRRHRRGDAGAHGGVLSGLARQSSGLGRQARLFRAG
ncbi:hypothetical protein BRDID11002_83000 [Bradyrhizobium diazoefficiens]